MTPPLISIAVPIYNTAHYLPAALDSLLAQDYPHWEALLWDDGSADGSAQLAAAYAARDSRFRLLGDGRNHGNQGIEGVQWKSLPEFLVCFVIGSASAATASILPARNAPAGH